MQEIQIYATASETVATVRDYANAKTVSAPSFVLGVSAKIRLTLFANPNNLLPLPLSELENVVSWSFVMDVDFDTTTAYKVVADNGSITLTGGTPDGAKYTEDPTDEDYDPELAGEYIPTVFTIPLPNMNSTTLNEWLGTAASKGGLIGELVGYDSNGANVFVLQIEGFTVRNRITGAGEPTTDTAVEYLTLDEARALFSTENNAFKPYCMVTANRNAEAEYTGRYEFFDQVYIGGTKRENVFWKKDSTKYIGYSATYKRWVLYSSGTTSKYMFPWIAQNSNRLVPPSGKWYYSLGYRSDGYVTVDYYEPYNVRAQLY